MRPVMKSGRSKHELEREESGMKGARPLSKDEKRTQLETKKIK
jgi:hypothetical protein